MSVGDLKGGFNQIANTANATLKLAVISPSGTWLPQGLTFGPTNGPEDFQEAVYIIFSRQLLKTWFLFDDDLAVATWKQGIGEEKLERLGETIGVSTDDLEVTPIHGSVSCRPNTTEENPEV